MLGLVWLAVATAGECPVPMFEFQGQPPCVALEYEDKGVVRLTNRCEAAVLLDQAVASSTPVIGAGATAEIVGLNRFTVGLEGTLYEVIATVAPACEAPAPTVELGAPDSNFRCRRCA